MFRSSSKYKRKTNRQSWDHDAMQTAIETVVSGAMGTFKAAKQFGVPQTTLERRLQKVRDGKSVSEATEKGMDGIYLQIFFITFLWQVHYKITKCSRICFFFSGLGRFKTVFSRDQEKELVSHIIHMEERLFGFSINDFRALAFDLAERNNLDNNFNKDKKRAGKCWYYSFLKRNPEISLRTPEATSLARAIGFNKVSVAKFFELLRQEYEKYNFGADRIWNVDETGVSTVPKKKSKVIGLKGKKQVGKLSSAERGTLVTAAVCMSAAGIFMPLMFIFPRKKPNNEFLDHAPPGTTAEFHETGWMQKEIFVAWFKRFVAFTNPTAEKPVLLLLDGHATHTKSLDLVLLAREHHVVIICFPPHCTHRMQPLDVVLMAPLSQFYAQEVDKWLLQHPGRSVSEKQVAELYGKAFMRAALMQTAVNGFRVTGIYPLDPNVFPDYLFEPSCTTERPAEIPSTVQVNEVSICQQGEKDAEEPDQLPEETSMTTPGSSVEKRYSSFSIASPDEVVKIPKAIRNSKKSRRSGKTAVLTSTPYKDELATLLSAKGNKSKVNQKRTLNKGKCPSVSKKMKDVASRLFGESSKSKTQDSSSSSDEENDTSCVYCNELYSSSVAHEGWIQCIQCKNWAHELCSGVDELDDVFICDYCH